MPPRLGPGDPGSGDTGVISAPTDGGGGGTNAPTLRDDLVAAMQALGINMPLKPTASDVEKAAKDYIDLQKKLRAAMVALAPGLEAHLSQGGAGVSSTQEQWDNLHDLQNQVAHAGQDFIDYFKPGGEGLKLIQQNTDPNKPAETKQLQEMIDAFQSLEKQTLQKETAAQLAAQKKPKFVPREKLGAGPDPAKVAKATDAYTAVKEKADKLQETATDLSRSASAVQRSVSTTQAEKAAAWLKAQKAQEQADNATAKAKEAAADLQMASRGGPVHFGEGPAPSKDIVQMGGGGVHFGQGEQPGGTSQFPSDQVQVPETPPSATDVLAEAQRQARLVRLRGQLAPMGINLADNPTSGDILQAGNRFVGMQGQVREAQAALAAPITQSPGNIDAYIQQWNDLQQLSTRISSSGTAFQDFFQPADPSAGGTGE